MMIVFDPGHTGKQNTYPEAVKPNGEHYYESEGMLELGLKLADVIPDSALTRYGDTDMSLGDRGRYAASRGADLFVSLHTNSSPRTFDKEQPGILVFYSIDLEETDKKLAEELAYLMTEHTGIRTSAVRTRLSENPANVGGMNDNSPYEDYYTVIDSAQDNGVPHIFLVEHGSHLQYCGDYDNVQNGCVKAYQEFISLYFREEIEMNRLAGNNRYDTAVEISKDLYPNGSDRMVICSGESPADQASASVYAVSHNIPLLYVKPTEIPATVTAEIKRLNVYYYIIVGGTSAVSEAVERQIQDMIG